MINHAQVAGVCIINAHASARFDRGLDDFPRLVHDVTGSVENITIRAFRVLLANDKRSERLITGSRSFLGRHFDDSPCYCYWFCGCLFLVR